MLAFLGVMVVLLAVLVLLLINKDIENSKTIDKLKSNQNDFHQELESLRSHVGYPHNYETSYIRPVARKNNK